MYVQSTSYVQEVWLTLRDKCPYSEFFWSEFSRIRTEYGEIIRVSPYSVRMLENTDQKNSQYAHILRSNEYVRFIYLFISTLFQVKNKKIDSLPPLHSYKSQI